MKRIFMAIIIVSMTLSLSACSKEIMDQISSKSNLLLEFKNNDYILLDGKSISKGKTKDININLNTDGKMERFLIERDHPNGLRIAGFANQMGQNFEYDIKLDGAFDSYGEIKEQYSVQISFYDFDNDKIKEIAVSMGNYVDQMQTLIYRFTNSTDKPFEYVGRIDGQSKMSIKDNNEIFVPVGSQGRFSEYKYNNKNLYEYDNNGTLKVLPVK